MIARLFDTAEETHLTLQLLELQFRCYICDEDVCYAQFITAIVLYGVLSLLLALI